MLAFFLHIVFPGLLKGNNFFYHWISFESSSIVIDFKQMAQGVFFLTGGWYLYRYFRHPFATHYVLRKPLSTRKQPYESPWSLPGPVIVVLTRNAWPPAGVFQDAYILRPITVMVYYTIITTLLFYYTTFYTFVITPSRLPHTFPKDIPIAFLRTHTWGSLKLMFCSLSWNLETTVPFQDRTVCKGITRAPPDTQTFNVFELDQTIYL